MRISIATGPTFPVPAVQGGSVPRMWRGLAEEFAAAGHEVTIICRAFPGQPASEVINNVAYVRRGGFSQSKFIALDLLRDLGYALRTLPSLPPSDILVVNDFWIPAVARVRARRVGKIVVNANRFPKGQYRLYGGASSITAASGAIRKAIVEQCRTAAPYTTVIPNPIDTNIFVPPRTPRLGGGSPTILYTGRVHPEKGVHLLIEAFHLLAARVPKARLRILGPSKESQGGGGGEYLRRVRALAADAPVEFAEPTFDVNKLVAAYHDADLFCYPSLAEKGEALPVAPIEAMATGLAPVVSGLSCFNDYIEENRTGYYFDHRKPDAGSRLAHVLASALLDREGRQAVGRQAARKALDYSYRKVAALYLETFEGLLKA